MSFFKNQLLLCHTALSLAVKNMQTYTTSKWSSFAMILAIMILSFSMSVKAQTGYIGGLGAVQVNAFNSGGITATISVTTNSIYGVAVSPDGSKVYTTHHNSGNISVITTSNNSFVTVNVGPNPIGVAVSPDGSKVYVTNAGGAGTVSVINATNNTVTNTITVGSYAFGVAVSPDGSKVYVSNGSAGTVSVINATNNTVSATITVGTNPRGIAISPDGTKVYVANNSSTSNSVSVINTADNTVSATIPVGANPLGVVVSPNGAKVYVSNNGSTIVSVINTSNNAVSSINLGGINNLFGISITPDGSKVYVTDEGNNKASVINTIDNSIGTAITGFSSTRSVGNYFPLVYPPPTTITNFTPTTAGIDAVITITGTNFTGATAVTIGGQAARSFTVVNSTTITAVTNDNIANGDVTVTNGTTATLAGFTAAIVPNGTITGATFETAGGFKVLRVVVTPATPTQFKQALRYKETGTPTWNNLTIDGAATSADIQGIAENKTYEIFLQTVSSAGHWSNRSAIFTSTNSGTGNFCSPTVAATAGISGTTITFNWTAQANATRYLVRYWEVNALGNQVAGSNKIVYVENGAANNVVAQGLKPTTNYAYDVQVYCGNTTATNRSNVITFTTGAGIACAAPSTVNFVQTTLDGYAALDATWSGATSVTTGSPKYQLRYKTTAGTSWSYWNTDATNYTMTGLEPSTQYDFQIVVFCNGGGAEWSSLYTPMTGAAPNSCPLVTLGASSPFSQAGGIVGANLVWTGIAPTAGRRFFLGYTKDGESSTVWRWIESNGVTVRSDLDYPNLIASSNYSYILQTYCNTWNFAGYAIGSPGTFTTGAVTGADKNTDSSVATNQNATNELVIYPNPSEGEVTIQTLQGFGNLARLELSVIDVLGREVYSQSFNGSVSVKLDGKTLRSGVYVAKIMEKGKVMTKKFVVK